MNGERGFITVASGERRYLEMATDLALSLREFNAEPVALALGAELRPVATDAELAVFDRVVALPEGYPKCLGKLAAPRVTPFDRTLFLDADSLAIGSLADVWDRLAQTDFAVQGRYLDVEEDAPHHLLSTSALARSFGVDRYLQHNSGILYFRKARGIAVAKACMDLWDRGFGRELPIDEPLLGIVGGAMGVSTIPKPVPMAWWPNQVEPHDTARRIVHFMGPVRADTLTWLLREMQRRREACGLPWKDSIMTWVHKATHTGSAWRPDKFPHLAFRRNGIPAAR